MRKLHLNLTPSGQWQYMLTDGATLAVPWQWGAHDKQETIEQARGRFTFDTIECEGTYDIETESRTVEANGWVEDGAWHTAGFVAQPVEIKGCPSGRSQTSVEDAIADLIRRTNDESGTSITRAQLVVVRHRGTAAPLGTSLRSCGVRSSQGQHCPEPPTHVVTIGDGEEIALCLRCYQRAVEGVWGQGVRLLRRFTVGARAAPTLPTLLAQAEELLQTAKLSSENIEHVREWLLGYRRYLATQQGAGALPQASPNALNPEDYDPKQSFDSVQECIDKIGSYPAESWQDLLLRTVAYNVAQSELGFASEIVKEYEQLEVRAWQESRTAT